MSLDFYLSSPEKKTDFSKRFLAKALGKDFLISEYRQDKNNKLIDFTLELISTSKDLPLKRIRFYKQKGSRLLVFTYDYEARSYMFFLIAISIVAKKIGLLLEDPQLNEKNIYPDKFVTKKRLQLGQVQQKVVDRLPQILKEADV